METCIIHPIDLHNCIIFSLKPKLSNSIIKKLLYSQFIAFLIEVAVARGLLILF